MKRHFAEAQPLVFQKEGCAYAIRPLRKHASPPRPYIRMRNAVCGCNLRSSHRTSLQRCRTERFKTSFFSSNGLFTIVMHFYIACIHIYIYVFTNVILICNTFYNF